MLFNNSTRLVENGYRNDSIITRLKIDLYCRDIAIRFSTANLINFLPDDAGQPVPYLWAGHTYQANMTELDNMWVEINWDEMPILAQIYDEFGEDGLSAWCGWRQNSQAEYFRPEIRRIYNRVMTFINRLIGINGARMLCS